MEFAEQLVKEDSESIKTNLIDSICGGVCGNFNNDSYEYISLVINRFMTIAYCYNKERFAEKIVLDVIDFVNKKNLLDTNYIYAAISGFMNHYILNESLECTTEISLNMINRNQKLARNLISYFVLKLYSLDGKFASKKSQHILINIFNKIDDAQKETIRPYLVLLLSEYFSHVLFSLRDDTILQKCFRDTEFEEEIFKLFKKYNIVGSAAKKLEDIEIDSIIYMWKKSFNDKLEYDGVDGGWFFEVLPHIFSDFERGKTVGDLFSNMDLFRNFYYVNKRTEEGIRQFKLLENEAEIYDDVFVVYTGERDHIFVSILKKNSTEIIDSDIDINYKPSFLDEDGIELFNLTSYQENGTCYLNAEFAFKIIINNYIKQIKASGLNKSDLTDEELDQQKNILNGILEHLYSQKEKDQIIVLKIFKEMMKFYELLEFAKNPQFTTYEYTRIPRTVLLSGALNKDLPINKNGKNLVKQTQLLKRRVQRLEIKYENFIVKERYMIKQLELSKYKIQCFKKDKEKIENIEHIDKYVSTNNNNIEPAKIDKIIATKKTKFKPVAFRSVKFYIKSCERKQNKTKGLIHSNIKNIEKKIAMQQKRSDILYF